MSERDRSQGSLRARAEEILESLPEGLAEAKVVCPLCKTFTPARGLMAEQRPLADEPEWLVVFGCPACGLTTTFKAEGLDLEHVTSLQPSLWSRKLRDFSRYAPEERVRHEQHASPRQMIGIAVLGFFVWILLTGNLSAVNLGWGAIVSIICARLSYRLAAIQISVGALHPRRWAHLLRLVGGFARQLIVQNVSLSIRVLRPGLPVRPGILAVPTDLEGEFKLSFLGTLLSLTPDTVPMDIDQEKGVIYVHWIDVQTTDVQEAKQILFGDLEKSMRRWLE